MTQAIAAPVQSWDKDSIQSLLQTNNRAVTRALLQIWARQTAGEQAHRNTQLQNHVGFTAADAPELSKLAKQVASGLALSPGQIRLARCRLLKYHRQLLEVIVTKQLETML